jgi:ligand-binding sensor domain-containing protein
MTKRIVLAMFFLVAASSAFALMNVTEVWINSIEDPIYAVAYNKTTGHLLVAGRQVAICSANTGEKIGTLQNPPDLADNTYFSLTVADDGVIYSVLYDSCDLVRWANESAAPTRQTVPGLSFTFNAVRCLKAYGSASNTRIYVTGGDDNDKIQLMTTTNGTDFTAVDLIAPPAAKSAVCAIPPGFNTVFGIQSWGSDYDPTNPDPIQRQGWPRRFDYIDGSWQVNTDFIPGDPDPTNHLSYSIAADYGNGILWVYYAVNDMIWGLDANTGAKLYEYQIPYDVYIHGSVFVDAQNNQVYWGARLGETDSGYFGRLSLTSQWEVLDNPNFINSIKFFNGEAWVCTLSGLEIYNYASGLWRHQGILDNLSSNETNDALPDGTKIWIGTWGGDLLRYENALYQRESITPCIASLLLYQDKLWLATYPGVASYDGTNIQWFTQANGSLSGDIAMSLALRNNELWVPTFWDGLNAYDGASWRSYTTANSALPTNELNKARTIGNDLWICTRNSGVVVYDGVFHPPFTSAHYHLSTSEVKDVATDGSLVWIATPAGIACYDGLNWTSTFTAANSPLTTNDIRTVSVAPDGTLWVGTWGEGIFTYDGSSWQQTKFPAEIIFPQPRRVESQGNLLWVGTDFGLMRYDGTVWDWFTPSNIRDISTDGTRTAVATWREVYLIEDEVWTVFTPENSPLATSDIRDIAFNGSELWIGTADNGLFRYLNGTWTSFHPDNSTIRGTNVSAIGIAPDKIYVATDQAFQQFDGSSWTDIGSGTIADTSLITTILYHNGSIYIAHWGEGIYIWNGSSFDHTIPATPWGNWIYSLMFDRRGTLWIGTYGGLAKKENESWVLQAPSPNAELGSISVYDLAENTSGLWFATSSGLWHLIESPSGTIYVTCNIENADFTVAGPEATFEGSGSYWFTTNAPIGDYTITFRDVPGYITPSSQLKTLTPDGFITFSGTYMRTGVATLSISTTPVAGGIFLDGVFKASGSWSGSVRAGAHTISFGPVSGYQTPADQIITISNGQTKSCTGVYVENPQYGTLQVTTNIDEASFTLTGPVTYRGYGTSWTKQNAPPGDYTIHFDRKWPYYEPADQTDTLLNGQTLGFSGSYIPLGWLSVTTEPESVRGEIFVDGEKKSEGYWSDLLPVGSHTVSFGDYPGYSKPADVIITVPFILDHDPVYVTGTYTPIAGTVNVNTNLDQAQYTVYGPGGATYSGSGKQSSFTDCSPGQYSISFQDVDGYVTPASEIKLLESGGTIVFEGNYYPETLQVPYYEQGQVQWCWACSLAMLLKYYGYDSIKPWEVARSSHWGDAYKPNESPDCVRIPPFGPALWILEPYSDYLNNMTGITWSKKIYNSDDFNSLKQDLLGALEDNKPVFFSTVTGEPHAFVIVGADDQFVRAHNPSAAVLDSMGPALQLPWDATNGTSFREKILNDFPVFTLTPQSTPHSNSAPITLNLPPVFGGFENLHFEKDASMNRLELCWDGTFPHGYVLANRLLSQCDPYTGIWKQWDGALPPSPQAHDTELYQYPSQQFSLDCSLTLANSSPQTKSYSISALIKNEDSGIVEASFANAATGQITGWNSRQYVDLTFGSQDAYRLNILDPGRYSFHISLSSNATLCDSASIPFKIGPASAPSATIKSISIALSDTYVPVGSTLSIVGSDSSIDCTGNLPITYHYEADGPSSRRSPSFQMTLNNGINHPASYNDLPTGISGTYRARLVIDTVANGVKTSPWVSYSVYTQTYKVSGYVRDSKTRCDISNAEMEIQKVLNPSWGMSTGSSSSGYYKFTGLENGLYRVSVSHDEYTFSPSERLVTISGSNVANVDFFGEKFQRPQYGIIKGVVEKADGGPIANAKLELLQNDMVQMREYTDSSGRYQFDDVEPGTYDLQAIKLGYLGQTKRNIILSGGETRIVNFQLTSLSAKGDITGRVKNNLGEWVSYTKYKGQVWVYYNSSYTDNVESGHISSDGYFIIPDLQPRTYYVKITADNHTTKKCGAVVVHAGETTDMGTIVLTKTSGIASSDGRIAEAQHSYGSVNLTQYGSENEVADTNRVMLLDSSDSWLVFSLTWEDEAAFALLLYDPEGHLISPQVAEENDDIEYYEDEGVIYYRIHNPMTGQWYYSIECLNAPYEPVEYSLSVSLDTPGIPASTAVSSPWMLYE